MAETSTVVFPMSRDEALTCIREIKGHQSAARQKAYELYQRQGWKALGYESFRACAEAEFGASYQHLYRLKAEGEAEATMRSVPSPAGELPTVIPGRHLRALNRAGLKEPEQMQEAIINAKQIAQAEGGKQVTERHVEQSAKLIAAKQASTKYAVVAHMVTTGDVTPFEGEQMVKALDRCKPQTRGYIVQLMAKYGLTCPDLIPELAQMHDRPPGKESKTLPVIERTGHVAGVVLKKATLTDLKRARLDASYEHRADATPTTPEITKVVINVSPDDMRYTLRELKRALKASGMDALFHTYIHQKIYEGMK